MKRLTYTNSHTCDVHNSGFEAKGNREIRRKKITVPHSSWEMLYGWLEEGRRKKEEGRRKKEEGRRKEGKLDSHS
ncbi:MAG: hypothetical protein F6K23_13790 [Okeania sp. SIO2C9]|uniref:hypothetical protein n=1 Tax=Okeania sp. SIO2C9 TaxID=2607791 RepID=UPI0013C0DCBE|nr:hypothetical protein [Okeania sp. SIO2C9]NEQ74017.1 hypothetical protein [Okeania sp. SIO2C9]